MAHGSGKFDVLAPRSQFYHGPFGRLFPDLPAWSLPPGVIADQYFLKFANKRMVELPGELPADIASDPTSIAQLESKFSSNIPAGYTYFGQFIDHDITFDPASSLMRQNDPNGLLNFRTPRLDLDNVYGTGPDDQPYLYDQQDKAKMAIGEIASQPALPDLPRYKDRALIGDMRNDENTMVSQLQLAFLLAHNTLVDRAKSQNPGASTHEIFELARQSLRWLYQHIVWNDFVPGIAHNGVYQCALKLEKACGGRSHWVCGLDDIYGWKNQPFMPVEFSVAAYRFGHSMVRNAYQTNNDIRGFGNFVPIFDNSGSSSAAGNLRGFRPMLPENCIQWDWFLPMQTSSGPFPQMARKIDTKLSNALLFLHEAAPGDPLNMLAFRNLKRGLAFGLPSGTGVAKKLCINPVKIGKNEPDSLWYYILREAQVGGGDSLGRVGSIIVCAVLAGLLKADPHSWFSLEPCWTPDADPLLMPGVDNIDDPNWTLASIIRLAGLKANGIGFASGG